MLEEIILKFSKNANMNFLYSNLLTAVIITKLISDNNHFLKHLNYRKKSLTILIQYL